MLIDFDLGISSLLIKTDSADGSDEAVNVAFFGAQNEQSGGLYFYFRSPPVYYLPFCSTPFREFPVPLPSATDKVWMITLTRTSTENRIVLHCYDVEVLNVLIDAATCSHDIRWGSYYLRDVKKIMFVSTDTASDSYSTYKQFSPGKYTRDWCQLQLICTGDSKSDLPSHSRGMGGGNFPFSSHQRSLPFCAHPLLQVVS